MAKVFTITEGLENMGALKTGGQGSVYKARRIGEIITAVKLLPTPIHSESPDDKHFADFQNEVAKLQKVAQEPNPNVVKIISSGITESGSFPFIEMEFIEGPDLEELLKPPHDPIFTIKETIKLAEQLANALAHCHKLEVKHGDIKSNNVKLNRQTGNYMLLDFGLAIMSDEQRRTSLRHAGAIEFMAPEQSEGQMLFQTDVYSFGIVLYELLAGVVPFPLNEKGEMSRNLVMVAHMETPPPDILSLRENTLPENWSSAKKEHEMNVPDWLLQVVYKCLQKKPSDRFANGMELQEYIVLNSTLVIKKNEQSAGSLLALQQQNAQLQREKENLQSLLEQYQATVVRKQTELENIKTFTQQNDLISSNSSESITQTKKPERGISKASFFALLLLTICVGAFAAYSLFFKKDNQQNSYQNKNEGATNSFANDENNGAKKDNHIGQIENTNEGQTKKAVMPPPKEADTNEVRDLAAEIQEPQPGHEGGQYKVVAARAYFHNKPDESTRRNAFLLATNNATLNALDDENGFIYVIYTNDAGQTSRGWLNKDDLEAVEEE